VNSESRNGAKVVWLAVHTTEGIMRAVDLRAWATWPGSSHAANDETGVLLAGSGDGFVDYSLAAWTLRAANHYSENLEQCGWARWTRAEWLSRPKLLDTTACWLADRSKARGIPLRRLTDDEIRRKVPGVLGHGDYSRATGDGTHTDPGPNYPWDVVLAQANAYANGDDMPITDDDARKIAQAVLNESRARADDPSRTINLGALMTNWNAANKDVLNAVAAVELDPAALASQIVAALPAGSAGVTPQQIEDALRQVLREGTGTGA